MKLGDLIHQYRMEHKISMQVFADKSGLSKGYISMLESGKNPRTKEPIVPSLLTLDGCAQAMGMDFKTLLDLIDENTLVSLNDDQSFTSSSPLPSNIEPMPKTHKVPLLGAIACGEPILAAENIDSYVEVPEEIVCDFVLRCKGDSMIDARIFDGDIVYIRLQPEVENGEIAAVLIDNAETEATLKRVYVSEDQIVLMPANPAYQPQSFTGADTARVRILGKAIFFTSAVR